MASFCFFCIKKVGCPKQNSFTGNDSLQYSAGVSTLRPAGQMRPAKPFHAALEAILSNDEKNTKILLI